MRVSLLARMVLVGSLITAVGCGSAPTQPSSPAPSAPAAPTTPPLTAAQISAIEGVFVKAEDLLAPAVLTQVENAPASGNPTQDIKASAACPDAGTVSFAGTAKPVFGAGSIDVIEIDFSGPIGFTTCRSAAVQIQGPLDTAGKVTAPSDGVLLVAFTITGGNTFALNSLTGSLSFSCSNTLTANTGTGGSTLVANGNVTMQYPTGQNTMVVPCADFAAGFTPPPIPLAAIASSETLGPRVAHSFVRGTFLGC
jgi:hypothetical protein